MNRRCLQIVLLTAGVSVTACTSPTEGTRSFFHSFEWATASPESQGIDTALLDSAIDEARRADFIKSLLVVRNGYLVSETYFDPNRIHRNTPWELRSATKSVTSALIGIALRHGFIDSLDQKVLSFFPEYDVPELDPRMADITIRHLLTMTGGISPDSEGGVAPGTIDFMEAIIELPLVSDPGAEWNYSSLGCHLLSGIISRAYSANFSTFARTYIGGSLGIEIPSWESDPQGHSFGGTGLRLMPRDMARFGYLFLEGGLVDEKQIVPAAWIEESLEAQLEWETTWGELDLVGYGYLWYRAEWQGVTISFAFGYAGQLIMLVPQYDLVIVTTAGFPSTYEQGDVQGDRIVEIVTGSILPSIVSLTGRD
ncbi:serine hydrolase domain-containing protein [Gemmatimonadota bacterium]